MKHTILLIVLTFSASVLSFSQTPQATQITDETLRLCIADVQTRQFEIAITDCGKAIVKFPNKPDGYQGRAMANANLKNTDAAIADYSKAIQFAPNNPDLLGGRGEMYIVSEKYDLALADFNKVLQMFPTNPLALYRRSSVYMKMGKNDLAVTDLKSILAVNPNDTEMKTALAQLEAKMKPFVFQGKQLATTDDFFREIETVRFLSGSYAGLPVDQREIDKVYELLSNCVYRFPDDYGCSKKLLEYYNTEIGLDTYPPDAKNSDGTPRTKFNGSRQAKWIEASLIPVYTAVLKKDTKDRWAFYNRGERYLGIKNYAAAVADFTKTIELDPKFGLNYTNRAKAYVGLKKYNEAIADSIKAVEAENYAGMKIYRQYELIDVYIAAAKYDVAIAEIDKLLAKDTKNATARLKRGLALRAQGKNDLAIAEFSAAVKEDPSYEQAYRERAATYRILGKIDLAIADEKQATMKKSKK